MKLLVSHLGNLGDCPRANRIVGNLGGDVARLCENSEKMRVAVSKSNMISRAINLLLLLFGFYEKFLGRKFALVGPLSAGYTTILCHDLLLLPALSRTFGPDKIVFDAREYYPREFEHRWLWRITAGRLADYVCRRYVPSCRARVTVSEGLARTYKQNYGTHFQVIPSYADFQSLLVTPQAQILRCVHHGNASKDRKIENMIDAFIALGAEYELNLFLVPVDSRYFQSLKVRAGGKLNIVFHKPVPFAEISKVINKFDVGLFVVPPSTFNLAYSLPNKIFEYIQARLMVVVSPLPEVSEFVKKNRIGLVTIGSEFDGIADTIASISRGEVERYKRRSNELAQWMTAERFVSDYKNYLK